jgi:hypothetical protein
LDYAASLEQSPRKRKKINGPVHCATPELLGRIRKLDSSASTSSSQGLFVVLICEMNLQSKRVLVTGADGFIGSHLVEHLLRTGAQVTALAHTILLISRAGWRTQGL